MNDDVICFFLHCTMGEVVSLVRRFPRIVTLSTVALTVILVVASAVLLIAISTFRADVVSRDII